LYVGGAPRLRAVQARNYYCIIKDAESCCKEKTARKRRFS
jgi:hypothetical protein